mgnify:CR=1 FL=1
MKSIFDSVDWIERIYNNKGEKIRLFAARSYDYKRLYHHPELALSHGSNFKDEDIVMLPGDPEIPVFVLRSSSGSGIDAYVLLHEGKFIKDPVSHQIKEAFTQLFQTRKAMTIFYVSDTTSQEADKFNKTTSAYILAAAIQSFKNNSSVDLEN